MRTAAYSPMDALDEAAVDSLLAPSETMTKAAERPLATQPGVASLQIERAKSTAAEIDRHLVALSSQKRRGDEPRLARLLLEEALAWERAADLAQALHLFEEAMRKGPELLPAVRGARRVLGLKSTPKPAVLLPLLEHESRLASKETARADLLVERARILEGADKPDHKAILEAYRNALTLRPAHAEALKGLEGALLRARLDQKKDDEAAKALESELAGHYGKLAGAYGGDVELIASCLASRALILERHGDLVGAEEAYASALVADGRVGPVREAYKRLLVKRGAWTRLRDVLAEEAGREHDLGRSVRLLHEAARISLERLGDSAQAISLLEHAASRAPTDPALDARVVEELVRLLESRGDTKGAAEARRAAIKHERDPAVRAIEYRRLGANYEASGNLEASVYALEQARQIEPLHVATQLALDRLYKAINRHDLRVALWLDEAAKARDPQRRAAAYVRAAHVAEDDLERPEEALDYLRAAWVTDTSNIDAFDELTRLLLPPSEMRHGIGGGEGRSARALIELFTQAAQTTNEPARRIAYLEKVAALWEDALGDPARAAEIYGKVLTLDPTRRFALLAMQRAFERSGEFRGLAAAVELEGDQATDPQHAAMLRLRAAEIWSSRVGDGDRAIALVRRVLEQFPDHAQGLRALFKAQEAAARHEDLVDTLNKMIGLCKGGKTGQDALPLWLELAEIQRTRLGRLDDAIASWRAVLAIDATHSVATRELSHALRTRGSWRAVADLEEAMAVATSDPLASGVCWIRAAEICEGRLEDDQRAQRAYARALAARPDDLSAWEGLARLAERRGALKELEAAYNLRIDREEGPARLALRLALGELLVRRGDDPKGAEAALEAVLAEAPANVHALRLVESVYRRTANDNALARTLTMMAQAAKDPLAKRGILWDLVRLQEARVSGSPPIAAYLLIYELDQTDEAALAGIVRLATIRLRSDQMIGDHVTDGLPNVRGLLAFGLRRTAAVTSDPATKTTVELRLADLLEDSINPAEIAEALSLYRMALARDPQSPTACAGVRRVGALAGDLAAQLEGETCAAEIAPDSSTRVKHLLRGVDLALRVTSSQGGGDENAIALALKALKTDADSMEAAAAASRLLMARNDPRRLVDALMEASASAKTPSRIVALAREGARVAHKQLDNVPVAIALLTQAREADGQDAELLLDLGELYAAQRAWAESAKSYQEAAKSAERSKAQANAIRAHKALAELYEGALDDKVRALQELKIVASLAPNDTQVQRRVASVLFDQGEWDGAEKALQALVEAPELTALEQADAYGQISEIRLAKGDKRGAERALRMGLKLDPELTHEAFGRLEAFHSRHGTGDAGLAAALAELWTEPGADPRWLLRLGQIEVHRLGRPNEGIAHLRAAAQAISATPRTASGTSIYEEAQLAFAEGLLAVGAHEDASRVLRDLLARDPSNALALDASQRALTALGRRDEALVLDELRAYYGYTADAPAFRARRLPPSPPRPQTLEEVAIYSHVAPPGAKGPPWEVLASLADQLGKIVPPDLGGIGLSTRDRLTARSNHPFRVLVDRAAHALGVAEVDLYVHDAPDQRILVENFETPAIIVPSSLKALPELEVAFALGRLVAKVATRTYLIDKLRPNELEDLFYAAAEPFGGPAPRARAELVEDLARRVQKVVSRKARRALEEIAPRLRPFEPVRFARAVDQAAIRVGYLLTGDLTSALDHLRRYEPVSVADLAVPDSTTGELVRFALSLDAAAIRRRLGTAWGA